MLSTPAYVASFAYLVLLVIILLTPGITAPAQPSNFGSRVMFVLFSLIPIVLSVYSINCFVVGGCHVWSWLNVAGIVIWVLLFGLSILAFHSATKKTISNEQEATESFRESSRSS